MAGDFGRPMFWGQGGKGGRPWFFAIGLFKVLI
jgi:hypothetical protein